MKPESLRALGAEHSFTEAELAELLSGSADETLLAKAKDLWLRPIRSQMTIAAGCAEKGLGELTVPEAMAWVYCLAYGGITGYVIGKVIGNLMVVALGGRR